MFLCLFTNLLKFMSFLLVASVVMVRADIRVRIQGCVTYAGWQATASFTEKARKLLTFMYKHWYTYYSYIFTHYLGWCGIAVHCDSVQCNTVLHVVLVHACTPHNRRTCIQACMYAWILAYLHTYRHAACTTLYLSDINV